jgi:hypothetical protein
VHYDSLGKVFASPSTWYRLIRDHQWRRPRQRVHPAKPKIGIRASYPNEIWQIRPDGGKCELKPARLMSPIVSRQLALDAGSAARKRRQKPRIDNRSRQSRRLNPPGYGVIDGRATTVAKTRAEKSRMS